MKRLIFLIVALFQAGALSAKLETVDIPQDRRNWVYIGETKVGEAAFVILGDTGYEWREAIIFRFVPTPENIPLTTFFDEYNRIITKDKRITTKVLSSQKDFMLFEWWTDETKKDAQHGWIQITRAPGGVKLFRYTTKNLKELPEIGKKWENIMHEYSFTMTPYNYNLNINWSDLGGKTWLEHKDKSGVLKYIPEGQHKNNWKEQFTLILIGKYLDYSFEAHFNRVVEVLKQDYGDDIKITPIILTEDILLFAWTNGVITELYKLERLAPASSIIIRYTSLSGDEDLPLWVEIMRNLNVTADYRYTIVPLALPEKDDHRD